MKNTILIWASCLIYLTAMFSASPVFAQDEKFANFAAKYRAEAQAHEKKKEWVLAMHKWKVARSFDPTDEFAYKKVIALRNALNRNKERTLRRGIGYYYTDKAWPAFKEFVKTLYWDPDNKLALKLLKTELVGSEFSDYEVQKGDSIRIIASKEYGNTKLGFVITYFNNLPSRMRTPPPGLELEIPVLSSVIKVKSNKRNRGGSVESASAEVDVPSVLAEAATKLRQQEFDEAIELAESVLEAEPRNTKAANLRDRSAFALGAVMEKEGQLYDAMNTLRKVSSSFKGIKKAIANLDQKLQQQIQLHYSRGIQLFTNEKLKDAITEWQQVLELNPYHEQARKSIAQAKGLLEKLKKVQ